VSKDEEEDRRMVKTYEDKGRRQGSWQSQILNCIISIE
jgi:hypothetical protein